MRAFGFIAATAVLLLSCTEIRDYEVPRPGGGITLLQRTKMGGGAAGWAFTELYLRFDDDETLYPVGVVDHGGVRAEWNGKQTLLLCFESEPTWVWHGVLRKGRVRVQVADCDYAPVLG